MQCFYTIVRSGKDNKGRPLTYSTWCDKAKEQELLKAAMEQFQDFVYMSKATNAKDLGVVVLPNAQS